MAAEFGNPDTIETILRRMFCEDVDVRTPSSNTFKSDEADELLRTAAQYEEQAKALRAEAQKKREAAKKIAWRPLKTGNIIAITSGDGKTEYFARESDAQKYLAYLNDHGIEIADTKNIEINLLADFWRE